MPVRANFADIYSRGMRDRSGIDAGNWSTAGEHGKLFLLFRPSHHWRNLFQLSQREKIVFRSSKLHVKEIRFEKQKFFFVASIKFVACASRENLSNRSPGVQIPRDICIHFGRYFYSTKCSRTKQNEYLYQSGARRSN